MSMQPNRLPVDYLAKQAAVFTTQQAVIQLGLNRFCPTVRQVIHEVMAATEDRVRSELGIAVTGAIYDSKNRVHTLAVHIADQGRVNSEIKQQVQSRYRTERANAIKRLHLKTAFHLHRQLRAIP